MPKILLQIRKPRSGREGGIASSSLKACFPFYQACRGGYIHRVRYGSIYRLRGTGEFRHWGLEMWCGMMGSVSKTRPNALYEFVPEGAVLCAHCEGKAIGAGQVDARKINGRDVMFQPRNKIQCPVIPEMPIQTS